MKAFEILSGKAMIVELPEGSTDPKIVDGMLYYRDDIGTDGIPLPPGTWQIVGMLPELCKCFVCGGDGKETCNNPDHGFLDAIGGVVGANESACPVCGHDEYHKVPNGGECECCEGLGILSMNQFIDACEEYDFDDSPVSPESIESAILAEGWYFEHPTSPKLIRYNTYMAGLKNLSWIKPDYVAFKAKWEQEQSRVLCKERCLVLRRVDL